MIKIAEPNFERQLSELINRNCQENKSDTPDFILAKYMQEALDAFNNAVNARERWYGRKAMYGEKR